MIFNILKYCIVAVGLTSMVVGCTSDAEPVMVGAIEKTVSFSIAADSGLRSRANADGTLTPGAGDLATELTYIIRNAQGDVVYGSGFPGSPVPTTTADGGWIFEVSLDISQKYEVFFAATDEVMPIGTDKYDSSKSNVSRYVRLCDGGIDIWTGDGELIYGNSETFTYYASNFLPSESNDIIMRRPTCEVILVAKGLPADAELTTNNLGWIGVASGSCNSAPRYIHIGGKLDSGYTFNEKVCMPGLSTNWDNYSLQGILDDYSDWRIVNAMHIPCDGHPEFSGEGNFGLELSWGEGTWQSAYIDWGYELDSAGCLFQPNTRVLLLLDLTEYTPTTSISFEVWVDTGFGPKLDWAHRLIIPAK